MNIDRRAILASLAALMGVFPVRAFAQPAPLVYRPAGPPVRFSFDAEPFLGMRDVLKASDWRYQTINPERGDLRGIIRHLPTGLAFLTVPEDGPGADPRLDMHMAYYLFGPAETVAEAERTHIARAAAYVAGIAEVVGGGSFYVPRETFDANEVDAPPFIVAETPDGFLLRSVA